MHNNLSHISDKPWSDYKESDYTLQQWHNACLIHNHIGPPTSKDQCKLPVKTPNGVVNSNGVQAAAAALAGARGGVKDISSDQRTSAINALKGYYKDMGKELPPSLQHAIIEIDSENLGKSFVEHHGVKGQKWGFRNKSMSSRKPSSDYKKVSELRKRHSSQLTNKQLKTLNERLNLEQSYNRLNPSKINKGKSKTAAILSTVAVGVTTSMLSEAARKGVLSLGKKVVNK